jgi:hypothetical protein
MLKIKKNKGQNTAEYAILIALVIGAIIAMQTYAQRGLQARMRGTALYMKSQMGNALESVKLTDPSITGNLAKTGQYEPYYQDTRYETDKDSRESVKARPDEIGRDLDSTKTRKIGGYDATAYNGAVGAMGQDN